MAPWWMLSRGCLHRQTAWRFMMQVTSGRCCCPEPSPRLVGQGDLCPGLQVLPLSSEGVLSRVSLLRERCRFCNSTFICFLFHKVEKKETISLIQFREQPQRWKKAKSFLSFLSRNNLYINCFIQGLNVYTKCFLQSENETYNPVLNLSPET